MKSVSWQNLAKQSADPARAKNGFERLVEAVPGFGPSSLDPEQARILAALFSGSEVLGNALVANPAWLETIVPDKVKFPRRKQGLAAETAAWLPDLLAAADYAGALRRLREMRQREMLRIAARDLARLGTLEEILQEISDLADICLDTTWQVCRHQFGARYGRPYHADADGNWHPTEACVLGMGKLGGQELNYSSDVDVLFVYSEEGGVFREVPARAAKGVRPTMTSHQFFNRLAEAFIAEVTRMTPEGTLYRIDLRLRPEGDTGPLSRSLASYENYYAQWGQTWERMMLIKARGVAGDASLAAEFLEMVQPFRYPRSMQSGVLREVAAMKDRIENEVVKAGELDRNVKLGRGGIREIEFVVQSLQLLHAGKQPFLQGARTLPALEKLVQYELIQPGEAAALTEAYRFLRDVEHRLQMEGNRQTHTIPNDRTQQERLARLMGFNQLKAFEAGLRQHARAVRSTFDRLLKSEPAQAAESSPFPRSFEGTETTWKTLLAEHRFRDPDKALRVLREFVHGPGYIHVSSRTSELAHELLPRLFALCHAPAAGSKNASRTGAGGIPLSDPDRVVTRLDSFIGAYGARSTLFELWHANPSIFDLLLLLFDRSEFLAELSIRTPDLVDELVTSGRLRQRKTSEETLRDLRHGLEDEDQHLWMRRYHQAELMRIGLRDILGLADDEQYLTELSALADACLQYALEVIMRRHKLATPPFVVVGLGKLGGAEIDYGSDLDILFVAGSRAKDLPKLGRYATELMDLVSRRTEQGILFQTDARLRPDGEKGLLVNTLKAYEDYYRNRAQLWEIQSLTRTRPVAGDSQAGARFQALAGALTDFSHPPHPLSAFQTGWKRTIHEMRMRIERERTPQGRDAIAIKTGSGGLIDAEFIAQGLTLEHGWREPATIKALERGSAENCPGCGEALINAYRRLRRVEGILRRWSYEGETVLPDEPAPFYRVSVRCGFETPEAFRDAVASWRADIRQGYLQYFNAHT